MPTPGCCCTDCPKVDCLVGKCLRITTEGTTGVSCGVHQDCGLTDGVFQTVPLARADPGASPTFQCCNVGGPSFEGIEIVQTGKAYDGNGVARAYFSASACHEDGSDPSSDVVRAYIFVSYLNGSWGYSHLDGTAISTILNVMARICAGEEVELPFRGVTVTCPFHPGEDGCDTSTTTVTVQLLSHCPTLPPPPDPPDPPDPEDCEGLDNCTEPNDAELVLAAFENYNEVFASHPFFAGESGTTHWTLENLNDSYIIPGDSANGYSYEIELYDTALGYEVAEIDGILIREDVFDPGGAFTDEVYEYYVYKIHLQMKCDSGLVSFQYIRFDWQIFASSGGDPPLDAGVSSTTFDASTYASPIIEGQALVCLFGPTYALFEFDGSFVSPAAGDDRNFLAYAATD
jgi:hypothetical protein